MRERLEYQIKLAQERFDNADPKYHRVYHDLQEQLEKRTEALENFEQSQLMKPFRPTLMGSEAELKELCDLAAEIPKIWHHPLVTSRERKEIIGCLIERVSVRTTPETVEGTLHWKSGGESPFYFYRKAGKYNLIEELHAQGCNTKEIIQRLETGRTSTGQSMKLHVESFYKIYKRLGLKHHSKPSWFKPLQEEAVQLRDEGKTCRQISDLFNRRGLKSLTGRPWSWKLIFNLISSAPRKPDPLKDIHREAFRDAHSRGLNLVQMAREFNERKIPRQNKRAWHPVAITRRWRALRIG